MVTRDAARTRTQLRVLHVIHRLGSGVETAVRDYARSLPEVEHHVVFSADPTCHDPAWASSPAFASTHQVASRPFTFATAVLRRAHQLRPDIVHAHSSIAGAVTRALPLGAPIVYTPHCFAFVREDLGRVRRPLFRALEAGMAMRTAALAACSPHEAMLGRTLLRKEIVHYVPNVAVLTEPDLARRRSPGEPKPPIAIVTSGRISAQKDPSAFATLARRLRSQDAPVSMCWVGAGDEARTTMLLEAGVEVTGWLSRAEATRRLAEADLYVHTASWEAAPLTVLEAAQLDVPILARHSEPLRQLAVSPLWTSMDDLVSHVEAFLATRSLAGSAGVNRHLRDEHSPQAQRSALATCYASVQPKASSLQLTTTHRSEW